MSAMTSKGPKLLAPAGTCDCHMHIIYPNSELPAAPGARPFPQASVDEYKAMTASVGIERCIMTQTPCFGLDNRWMLRAIEEFGAGALGTAAISGDTDRAELDRLTDAGIRGVALHMLDGGWIGWDEVPAIARKAMEVDWHLHIQLDGLTLEDHLALLLDLPNTLVIDHIGKFSGPAGPDSDGFQALLRLVDAGRCYVKLSAPYESAWGSYPYMDHSGGLAPALIKATPERMIWGSNWPHLGVPDPTEKPDDAALLDTLLLWSDNPAEREMILRDNPARLYGFD
jgi:D-galactarolactone isomerase